MKKIEDECVACVTLGLSCLGDGCLNRHIVRFYCDECGCEEKLYHYDNEELCAECILKKFDVVEGSN